jgi:hypothetical protein
MADPPPRERPDAPNSDPGKTAHGIDTTPTALKPPADLVAKARRDIPTIFANVPPRQDGTLELAAWQLVKQLQDRGNTLAAAHWALHDAVRAGHLITGVREVEHPKVYRQEGRRSLFGEPDTRRMVLVGGGKKETIAIPQGKPTPYDCFKVVATESLGEWWRSLSAQADAPEAQTEPGPALASNPAPKRSTQRGEAREKLVAALTKHHQYADDSCLNLEPIGNNALARLAKVGKQTASHFFEKAFKGHRKYSAFCRSDAAGLVAALKLLNDEFAPHDLYGAKPPEKRGRRAE